MKWAGHVTCMGQMINDVHISSNCLKKRGCLGDEADMEKKYEYAC
jgi:hypothetical protein